MEPWIFEVATQHGLENSWPLQFRETHVLELQVSAAGDLGHAAHG